MDVLLSIKPKYVEEIMNGKKKYEFRKAIFRKKNVSRAYIYSSSPIKKIVGYFNVEDIIIDDPDNLWKRFENEAGINKSDFFNYFDGREKGYAIKIGDFKKFPCALDPETITNNFIPPQSFYYVDDQRFKHLRKMNC